MSSWQLIFLQSRANNGAYDGDGLPAHNWHWPQETWFQKRRNYLRTIQAQIIHGLDPAGSLTSQYVENDLWSPAGQGQQSQILTTCPGASDYMLA